MKTLFISAKAKKDILPAAKAVLKEIKGFKKIGVLATIQFVQQLPKVKKLFAKEGKGVFTSPPNRHCTYPGQVLGCTISCAKNIEQKVGCFVYFGTGQFHPLGIALKTEKPVFAVNPFTSKVAKIPEQEKRDWLKRQAARISKAKGAKVLGILVSTKPGQYELQGKAAKIRESLEKKGKSTFIFITGTIVPPELLNFPSIHAWINTACPRLVDDQPLFKRPIVNVQELFS